MTDLTTVVTLPNIAETRAQLERLRDERESVLRALEPHALPSVDRPPTEP